MTTNEKAFVVAMIQEYEKIHISIDNIEKKLDLIEQRRSAKDFHLFEGLKEELTSEVEKLATFRNVEVEFWDEIAKKYGPGEFDPTTFEYKIKPKNGNFKNSTIRSRR
jgi:hypothetical protein